MHGTSYLYRLKVAAPQVAGSSGTRQQEQEYDLVGCRSTACDCFGFLKIVLLMLLLLLLLLLLLPQPCFMHVKRRFPQIRLLTLQLISSGAKEQGEFSVKYTRMQVCRCLRPAGSMN
jgi:hypothetical protein